MPLGRDPPGSTASGRSDGSAERADGKRGGPVQTAGLSTPSGPVTRRPGRKRRPVRSRLWNGKVYCRPDSSTAIRVHRKHENHHRRARRPVSRREGSGRPRRQDGSRCHRRSLPTVARGTDAGFGDRAPSGPRGLDADQPRPRGVARPGDPQVTGSSLILGPALRHTRVGHAEGSRSPRVRGRDEQEARPHTHRPSAGDDDRPPGACQARGVRSRSAGRRSRGTCPRIET